MARPTSWRGRLSMLVVPLVAGLGLGAVAAAPPSAAAPAPAARSVCAVPEQPDWARCFAQVRTDIAARPHLAGGAPSGYGPADLADAYALPGAGGEGRTVAIVDAYDNPQAEADLAVYRAQYGLPACTTANGCFRKINQRGADGPLPAADEHWGSEIALDLDMVSAVCPDCHILLVEADDAMEDNLGAAVNAAVDAGAKYVSNSYGGFETYGQSRDDGDYHHPGVAVVAASGDYGFGVSYPSSAPGVVAVGGTTLTRDSSARGWSETAWRRSGGGCSQYTPKPTFQVDPDCAFKSTADVSAVADPATGVAVYNHFGEGGWTVYGGTSAAAPIVTAAYALAGAPTAGSEPESYPYQHTGDLHDVTSGSTGSCQGAYACTAGPGYDSPTGLGTPNGVSAFRGGAQGVLRGVVRDSGTHAPIAGAVVTAGANATRTSSAGVYTLTVAAGTYDVQASAYGHVTATDSGVTVGDRRSATASFDLDLVPSRTVRGTVTDASGHGWPLYAKITVKGGPPEPVYTDPVTGAYQVTLPIDATYRLEVDPVAAGYAPRTVSASVAQSDITKNIAVGIDDSCTAPGYGFRYAGATERFDGGQAPAGWTVVDHLGNGETWAFDDPRGRGNMTGGSGGFAVIDSRYYLAGHSQDTDLVSPAYDLSDVAQPVLSLHSNYMGWTDSSAAIDYSIDGGTTWQNIWSQGEYVYPRGLLRLALPQAAGQSDVRVRFHYVGNVSMYWEVDDVFVGRAPCVTVPGGLATGFVKDATTGAPLAGAKVAAAGRAAAGAATLATPDDKATPDGYYSLFLPAGATTLTAKKSRYTAAQRTVAVTANTLSRKDFRLPSGRLAVSGGPIVRTLAPGGSAAARLTLTNTGTAPLTARLTEIAGTSPTAPAAPSYAGASGAPLQRVPSHPTPAPIVGGGAAAEAAPSAPAPADGPWQPVADLPIALSGNSVTSHDGLVYSLGGVSTSLDKLATLYQYDPATDHWMRRADMGAEREQPASGWIDGKLYVTGGWDIRAHVVPQTEAYDPVSNAWTTVAVNPDARGASGAAVLGGKFYTVGGGCSGQPACAGTDVQVYDPATDSWSAGPAYPEATEWLACGTIDGAIYCSGGTDGHVSSAHTYAFDGSSWTRRADAPGDFYAAAASVADGRLVVSGGAVAQSTAVSNETWSYDPASDAWTSLPNALHSYYRMGGACGFYTVGGSTSEVPGDPSFYLDVDHLAGYDACADSGADVGWLSAGRDAVTLAPGASVTVVARIDTSGLTQPGRYTAALGLGTDTPYSVSPVAVTLRVGRSVS